MHETHSVPSLHSVADAPRWGPICAACQIEKHLGFENASRADDFPTALRRIEQGYRTASANWTCAACSAASQSSMLACSGCGMQRSLAEHTRPAEHVEVTVPDDVSSLRLALEDAQRGLRREWNSRGRSAAVTVISGAHIWEKELHVLCNMSLSLFGRGFQGYEGGQSLGRWWWHPGSHGEAQDMYFAYSHPHRSPAVAGVPLCHLEPEMTIEEAIEWFHGRHPVRSSPPLIPAHPHSSPLIPTPPLLISAHPHSSPLITTPPLLIPTPPVLIPAHPRSSSAHPCSSPALHCSSPLIPSTPLIIPTGDGFG